VKFCLDAVQCTNKSFIFQSKRLNEKDKTYFEYCFFMNFINIYLPCSSNARF